MAIVLEANYCKKLGLPGYSSHQYGVTIRAELSDINQVPQESERIYRLLQNSVDAEIKQTGWLPGNGEQPPAQGAVRHGASNDAWQCSLKQQRLILKIVEEHKLDKEAIDALARQRFGKGVRQLNRMDASSLIEELLSTYGANQTGNGRRGSFARNGHYATNGSQR